MSHPANKTELAQGNIAMRAGELPEAIRHYVKVVLDMPVFGEVIASNLAITKKKYRAGREGVAKPKVAVCGWDLAHNAAGRVYTLATLYETFADVEIIGSIFPNFGRDIWEPIRNTKITKHSFIVENESDFFDQAISLVLANPYDIVHLSKPRAPNIFFGILYKLIWDSKILIDVDDEELAFVDEKVATSTADYLKQHKKLPDLINLAGSDWTRLAVGLVKEFDGVTVSSAALQEHYGGEIIRHARDQQIFDSSSAFKRASQKKFGIPKKKKVVLFFGTPREHKGLVETAESIASLNRTDLVFVIVGDFPDPAFKAKLSETKGCDFVFVGNQPFNMIHEVVSVGDYVILLQDPNAFISQFQIPAKLTDALAAGLIVVVNECPPISDIVAAQAVVPVSGDLKKTISEVLDGAIDVDKIKKNARSFFEKELTTFVNGSKLKSIVASSINNSADARPNLYDILKAMSTSKSYPFSTLSMPSKLSDEKVLSLKSRVNINTPRHLVEENVPAAPRPYAEPLKKLPITVLIITWDVGHNPLGRSYMLAEVVQRIARHSMLVGFQFPRYGDSIWEPVRQGEFPVISLPGSNLPEFRKSLQRMSKRIRPDVVIACKPRLPSVELGLLLKEQWGCPLIVDVDDHELSFFKNKTELTLSDLAKMPYGSAAGETEPYSELWTRLTQSLCKLADEIIVSNIALQREFGGTIVPHVRDERTFDPGKYNSIDVRRRYGIPENVKVVLFFGTPRAHKGIDKLAMAVNQIDDPLFRLLIVGEAPDRSVTAKLETLAPGRIIYLPNQPFAAIPEILSMANIVCLPQDEGHAISQFQLPAKAIDAVAMGVPLLVSRTPPLMQLVEDGVARLVESSNISAELERLGGNILDVKQWSMDVRDRFLSRYSYHSAALQMRTIIQRCIDRKTKNTLDVTRDLFEISNHVLGLPLAEQPSPRQEGIDIVVFWKQNDTNLYGRRHDMVIKYLASRSDIRRVVVFDAPISEFELIKRQGTCAGANQDRSIYVGTYEKLFGTQDKIKISHNVFVYPPGTYRTHESHTDKPQLIEGYIPFVKEVLGRESVDAKKSVFWIYPKNYLGPELIHYFKPAKVVVDVVDDHRAWPNTSDVEKQKLTDNYRRLLAAADMAFTNCKSVEQSMKAFFPSILMVPNGCDSTPPTVIPKYSFEYEAFCNWPGKTIGYIGNLESKIDIELINKIAERFADCQIVLIGSTHANPAVLELKKNHNIRMPGVVSYAEAGAWVSRFDVGLVPHLNTELTKNMNPLKAFVYLTFNVPVVSTEIGNIDRNTSLISVASNHDDFILAVDRFIQLGRPLKSESEEYVANNSWSARLKKHVDLLLSQMH